MSYDDDTTVMNDTVQHMRQNGKIEIIADMNGNIYSWIDLACKKCDNGLLIVQINPEHDAIKLICSRCKTEEIIDICIKCGGWIDEENDEG